PWSNAMRSNASRTLQRVFNRRLWSLIAASLAISTSAATARADRPSAMKLFPEETRVFIRMANAHDFGEKMQQTSMGRMMQDPQMKPFVEHVYGKAAELYAKEGEGRLGISWDDLKKLPQGEVAFGVVSGQQQK